MTTIVIEKDQNGMYKTVTCMGHAEYAKRGQKDILCATISYAVINTMNSLEELAGEKFEYTANETDGFIRCIFNQQLQERSVFLLDSMVYGLQNIEKKYGKKYLNVRIEEV